MNTSALVLCPGSALLSQHSFSQVSTPVTLQAETYSHMNGVQLKATTDTGGGQNVGWIDANDWLSYAIFNRRISTLDIAWQLWRPDDPQNLRHFNSYGWAATNWAWKTTSSSGSNGDTSSWAWGMITNSNNGGAMGGLNVSNASAVQIEDWSRQFSTQPLVRNESIAYWMNWKAHTGQRIEAEMFKDHNGIRMETTTDTDGGFNAGSTDDNDWMSYPINIPVAGSYTLQARVSSLYTGGFLVLSRNGIDRGAITVPYTGGWQNWQTVSITVNLAAGQQDLAIFVRKSRWNYQLVAAHQTINQGVTQNNQARHSRH